MFELLQNLKFYSFIGKMLWLDLQQVSNLSLVSFFETSIKRVPRYNGCICFRLEVQLDMELVSDTFSVSNNTILEEFKKMR